MHRGNEVIPPSGLGHTHPQQQGGHRVRGCRVPGHQPSQTGRASSCGQLAVTKVLATSASLEEATPGSCRLSARRSSGHGDDMVRRSQSRRPAVHGSVQSPSVDVSNLARAPASSLSPREWVERRVWASGEPHWIENVGEDTNFPREPLRSKMTSTAGSRSRFCCATM